MSVSDIRTLSKIRKNYQIKLGRMLSDIDSDAVLKWMKVFEIFWKYQDRNQLFGSTIEHKRVSAALAMREKRIFDPSLVPDIVYELMKIRNQELLDSSILPCQPKTC